MRKSEKQKHGGELIVTYIIGFLIIRGIVELLRILHKIYTKTWYYTIMEKKILAISFF